MPPPGLTLLAAPTCAASQRLLPTVFRLAFLTRGVIEVVCFNGALSLAVRLIGERSIA
jgi:hypothetical protein